jgi:HAD superfamily hydrolase (TIGR01509 family)
VIKAIVFDFDGVLADSEPLHLRAYQEVLSALGLTLTREEYYSRYLGYDDHGVFSNLSAAHGFEIDARRMEALIAQKGRAYDAIIESGDVLYPGAAACVARMAAAFPLGIASGALRHEIEAILRAAQMDRYFRFIVASGDTKEGKPAPDPYRRAAELHEVAAQECLAIEDSRWGIESARAAGLRCVAITHTYARDELSMADAVVDSLDEFTPAYVSALR